MIFSNDDFKALSKIERDRLEEEEDKVCPMCASENPAEFYVSIQTDECVGCSECVNKIEWIDY